MKGGTLFSGIGAPEVAMPWIDWRWHAEIEPFPAAVMDHHFQGSKNLGDVSKIAWKDVEPVDILIAGPPCQAFSVAGLRNSLDDDRGNLSLVFARAVHVINPAFVVYENVPGILSTKDNAFGCVLAGLVGEDDAIELPTYFGSKWPDAGVISGPDRTAAWRILDAQFFGVPQRRRRVFIVSVRGSGNWKCASALFPVATGMQWNPPPSREARARIAASLTRGADSSGKGGYAGRRREDDGKTTSNLVADSLRTKRPGEGGIAGDDTHLVIAGTLAAHTGLHDGGGQTYVVANCLDDHMGMGGPDDNAAQANHLVPANVIGFSNVSDGSSARNADDISDPITCRHGDPGMIAYESPLAFAERGTNVSVDGDCSATMKSASDNTGGRLCVAFSQNTRDEVREIGGNVAGALAGQPGMKQQTYIAIQERAISENANAGPQGKGYQEDIAYTLEARHHVQSVAAPTMVVRRLTPRECERLQGFPDNYTAISVNGKPAADGPRYRALGNSMAVPVLEWIGRRIMEAS